MASDRTPLRAMAAMQRRPPVAAKQPSAVAVAPSPGQMLQQRLGNDGAQLFAAQLVARFPAPGGPLEAVPRQARCPSAIPMTHTSAKLTAWPTSSCGRPREGRRPPPHPSP